jgi:hypothetical protein
MSRTANLVSWATTLAALVATGSGTLALAKNAPEGPKDAWAITIKVYDYAHVNRRALLVAEKVATGILAQAGVDARWVDCPTSNAEWGNYPDCQSVWQVNDYGLRVMPNAMVDSAGKWQDALGVAYDNDGLFAHLANVFYDRVNSFSQGGSATMPVLLGRAMAHEIGHLLLGSHSHSSKGIMRPFWSGQDLRLVVSPHLLFTPDQSRQMKARLAARAQAWQAQAKVANLGRP